MCPAGRDQVKYYVLEFARTKQTTKEMWREEERNSWWWRVTAEKTINFFAGAIYTVGAHAAVKEEKSSEQSMRRRGDKQVLYKFPEWWIIMIIICLGRLCIIILDELISWWGLPRTGFL